MSTFAKIINHALNLPKSPEGPYIHPEDRAEYVSKAQKAKVARGHAAGFPSPVSSTLTDDELNQALSEAAAASALRATR